jgi:hypothetical protein
MVMLPHHDEILLKLAEYNLLTEHELAAGVANKLKQKDTDVMPKIGPWLLELKTAGLIWAGQLFNVDKQYMWAACLTKKGKDIVLALK